MQPMDPALSPNEKSLQQTLLQARTLSFAMMGSILMFGFVLHSLQRLVFNFDVLKQNLAGNSMTQFIALAGIILFGMHSVVPDVVAKKASPTASQRLLFANILKLALLEATALTGFMIALMTEDATIFAVYGALAIFTILFSLPNRGSMTQS